MKLCECCGRENDVIALSCRDCGAAWEEVGADILPPMTRGERRRLVGGLIFCLALCFFLFSMVMVLPGYVMAKRKAMELQEQRTQPAPHPTFHRAPERHRVMVA